MQRQLEGLLTPFEGPAGPAELLQKASSPWKKLSGELSAVSECLAGHPEYLQAATQLTFEGTNSSSQGMLFVRHDFKQSSLADLKA